MPGLFPRRHSVSTPHAGGVPACLGSSTDPTNPANFYRPGSEALLRVHYKPACLLQLATCNSSTSQSNNHVLVPGHLRDGGKRGAPLLPELPYAYFSAYQTRNGYNRYGTSDCASLGVSPYAQSASAPRNPPSNGSPVTTQYYNPSGYQIISSGTDGTFGQGSLFTSGSSLPQTFPNVTTNVWNPASAANSPALLGSKNSNPPQGADDQANFNSDTLGTSTVN